MRELKDTIVPDVIHEILTASEDGIEATLGKLSQYVRFPIIVTDSLYNVISSSITKDSIDIAVSTYFEKQRNTAFFKCMIYFDGSDIESIGYPIQSRNENLGYIFLLHNNPEPAMKHESLIRYAAGLMAFHMRQEKALLKEKQQFKDAFLFDILYGNIKNKEDIISYGQIWGWDFHFPHLILVSSIKEFNYFSADKRLIETLLYQLTKTLAQHGIEPITIKKQNEVIAFIPTGEKTNLQERKNLLHLIEYFLTQTKETELKGRVSCGVGQIYENPVELYRSYQEAKVAYELGLLLEICIPFFNDLGLERILYKHDLQDLKEFYETILGALLQEDGDSEGELMATLESFALHQFDLKQTSESLFLHRNTLRYRIKKIEEILEIKLDDMNNRLNITAALKIKQLHKL